jgi:hypothetical protein
LSGMAKRKTKHGNQGKTLPCEKVALILSVAAKDGVPEAVAKYGVAERTIRRWRAKVESGKWPEVAELVTAFRREAVERCKDLLTEAYEISLRRLVSLMPTATIEQAIKASEMCGGLKLTKDALGGEPDGPAQTGGGPPKAT